MINSFHIFSSDCKVHVRVNLIFFSAPIFFNFSVHRLLLSQKEKTWLRDFTCVKHSFSWKYNNRKSKAILCHAFNFYYIIACQSHPPQHITLQLLRVKCSSSLQKTQPKIQGIFGSIPVFSCFWFISLSRSLQS